jgi:hypothetical protein
MHPRLVNRVEINGVLPLWCSTKNVVEKGEQSVRLTTFMLNNMNKFSSAP